MEKWQLEEEGTLGEGSEHTPVVYPRPDADRSAEGDADPAALDSDHSNDSGQPAK